LISYFAEHYLDLAKAGYEPLPDLQVLHPWLKHLHFEIRPALLECWKAVASRAGFELGDLIEVDGTKLYPVQAAAYPDLDDVTFTGFEAKKDGSPGKTYTDVEVRENTVVTRLGKKLEASILTPLFFRGIRGSRTTPIKEFLENELSKLS
jgi:hypothetical protein